MITESESAYPIVDKYEMINQQGLTIRQLFSKDAPDDIPYWFVSIHEDAPKFPDIPVDLDESKQKEIKGWIRDPIFDLPVDLSFFQDLVSEYYKAKDEWELKTTEERYFQWRTYYADKLIAELNKTEK